jgi:hypothetical protein
VYVAHFLHPFYTRCQEFLGATGVVENAKTTGNLGFSTSESLKSPLLYRLSYAFI